MYGMTGRLADDPIRGEALRDAPKVLFVPVSGAYGMGEFARSLALALAVKQRWQGAEIRFILSRQAPYAGAAPFQTVLLDSSPTFHSAAVIAVMSDFRPDVVVFDNAGRTAQLRAAKKMGARLVYISARRRQRNKAFRWRWMLLIDEHWIAYPKFIAGDVRFLENLKRRALGRPTIRFLDFILSSSGAAERDDIHSSFDWEPGTHVLIVPGAGTRHPGAHDAVAQFYEAACDLAASGMRTVFVGPSAREEGAGNVHLRTFKFLPQKALGELIRSARLVITNGGDTLMQAIGCAVPSVAIPIAKDQPERIRRCVRLGVTIESTADSADMVRIARSLLHDAAARRELTQRAAAVGLVDGIQVAMSAFGGLFARAGRR